MADARRKRLLIIAFHFPPLQLSSGVHRTLSLARYLPNDGWDVSILTVIPSVYRRIHDGNLSLIPKDCRVIRTPAIDTSRHLSIHGRYPRIFAVPDSYQSWIATAVPAGIWHCRRHRPDVILSTFPIASAHYIGRVLAKVGHIPWVADFRDPMAQNEYPRDGRLRRYLHKFESQIVELASHTFVTTPGAQRIYCTRYADHADKIQIVPNGFDPETFPSHPDAEEKSDGHITLLHSGSLYRNERDPTHLFEALARLNQEESSLMRQVRIVLRGTRHAGYFREMVSRLDISEIVIFREGTTYQSALSEMLAADGLLLLQARNCNEQIPAKVYEYMYARKPILALTDPAGDTAKLLASCGVKSVARLDNTDSIAQLLKKFLKGDVSGFHVDSKFDVDQFSRQRIAKSVSHLLSELVV